MPADMDDKPSVWLKEFAVDVAATAIMVAVLFGYVMVSFLAQENDTRGIFSDAALQRDRNASDKGVDWQFTTSNARTILKRLYPQY